MFLLHDVIVSHLLVAPPHSDPSGSICYPFDALLLTLKGRVWSAGYPQYGQLGDGDDHMYNAKECKYLEAVSRRLSSSREAKGTWG